MRWPFTGGRYRLALAIYRGEVPTGAGHLPEAGTRRGRYLVRALPG